MKWVLQYQEDYVAWVRRLRERRASEGVRPIIRRILFHLAVNVALVAAFFLGALVIRDWGFAWLQRLPGWMGDGRTLLWLGALVLSLPVMIAFVRKLQALGMLLSELAIRQSQQQRQRVAMRALVSNTILFAGTAGIGMVVLALSAPLLPAKEVLIVLCAFAGVLAVLFRAQFIRLYSRAQNVIQETLTRPHPVGDPESTPAPALPPLLKDAALRTVHLSAHSIAVGRSLRELGLRTRCGASVIALRRGPQTWHNPEADQLLESGDELLLLGREEQLQTATELLLQMAAGSARGVGSGR